MILLINGNGKSPWSFASFSKFLKDNHRFNERSEWQNFSAEKRRCNKLKPAFHEVKCGNEHSR